MLASGAERQVCEGRLLETGLSPMAGTNMDLQQSRAASRYSCSRKLVSNFEVGEQVLGRGGSATVRAARRRHDGKLCAVKSLVFRSLSQTQMADLRNEIEIYLTLDHPHIAHLEHVYETQKQLHIVMECLSGGELSNRILASGKLSEEDASETMRMVFLAVSYLHYHRVAHRDLKPENFVYASEERDHLKLIDFGLSCRFTENTPMRRACGTTGYTAPEVLSSRSYTNSADLWSAGVIAHILLTGEYPLPSCPFAAMRELNSSKPWASSRFTCLSPDAQDFVKSLLVISPTQRLTASAALRHPWLSRAPVAIDNSVVQSLRRLARVSASDRLLAMRSTSWSESAKAAREQFLALSGEEGVLTFDGVVRALNLEDARSRLEVEAVFLTLGEAGEISYSAFNAAAMLSSAGNSADVEDLSVFGQFETCEAACTVAKQPTWTTCRTSMLGHGALLLRVLPRIC